jgi:hypothetical protein
VATGLCGVTDFDTLFANADGHLDVAFSGSCSAAKVSVLLNDGLGGFLAPIVKSDPSLVGAQLVVTRDFDEDGRTDVLTGHGDSVVVWRSKGDGTLHDGFYSSAGGTWGMKEVQAGDFDGDGHLDLAAVSWGSTFQGDTMTVHPGWGDGTFGPPQVYWSLFSLQYGGAAGVDVLDVDDDGALDIVAGCYGAHDVALFVNKGDGTFLPQERHGVRDSVYGVCAGDFDGDGLDDVVVNLQGGISVLRAVEPFDPVSYYCTAKTNSLGCTPQILTSGTPSAGTQSGFVIAGASVRNNKFGVLLYGTSGKAAVPFQGGFFCQQTPVRRSIPSNAGGNPPPANDCSGVYTIDMAAFAAGHLGGNPLPALRIAGTSVTAQWWGRDQGFPFPNNTTLSNAVEWIVQP